MALVFKSSTPESFTLTGIDKQGRKRTVTATKESGNSHWDLTLRHPSGTQWPGRYFGDRGILDAMSQMLVDRDIEFRQDAARNDRPPAPVRDDNVRVDGFGQDIAAPITKRW